MQLSPENRRPFGRNVWLTVIALSLIHLAPFGAIWTGVAFRDIVVAVILFEARVFFLTAGYHRYFAHRSYDLGRAMQFLMAFGGGTAAQKGALWWAGWHRLHHRYSDAPGDPHSPRQGFFWSHMGWFLCREYKDTPREAMKDFLKIPELRWLDRWYYVPPACLGAACYLYGGMSCLLIGFFLSTAVLYHVTYCINSITHLFGKRRYETGDDSRNLAWLGILAGGEGWHNNHHRYPGSANQGFFWWEIDTSFYVLKCLEAIGLARNLRKPPLRVLDKDIVR